MKNILVLGYMADLQTGMYIVESAERLGNNVEFIDIRVLSNMHGSQNSQKIILHDVDIVENKPDIIIVLKGLELAPETIKAIKLLYPKATLVNWFFDIYIGQQKIWDAKFYFPTIKLFDYYFCSLKGVANKLKDRGLNNVYCIREACNLDFHGEQYMNAFQKKKYGSDIAFAGSMGFHNIHHNRIKTLDAIIKSGSDIKIWGNIIGESKSIPISIRRHMVGVSAVNETHAMVCQSSLINLGLDAIPELYGSMSARIYRVMCAGGLYLSTATKGIDELFKINKKGEEITSDQDLVVFYDDNDLINKIDFLLENNDIRESIANNGKEKVLCEHKFTDRIKEMVEMISDGRK